MLRHLSGAQRAAKAFADRGYECLVHPLFQVRKLAHGFQATGSVLLVTSGSVFEVCTDEDLEFFHKAPQILCVGIHTARMALMRGLTSNVIVTGRNSAHMIAYIQKHFTIAQKFCHVRGKVHHFDYDALTQKGFQVETMDMYELALDCEQMHAVEMLIKSHIPLWLPLYSAQMVEALMPILKRTSLQHIMFSCVSQRVYDFLQLHLCHKLMCVFTVGRLSDLDYSDTEGNDV